MILSMLVLAIVAATGSRWLHEGFGAFYLARETTPLAVTGMAAMDRITRELREARLCASNGLVISANAIQFTNTGGSIRVDQNGAPNNAIYFNGQRLVSDVRPGSLIFQADPAGVGDPCLIRVGFLMEQAPTGADPIRLPLRTAIQIWNR